MRKPYRYSRSTMMKWTKDEIIDYARLCEANEQTAYATLEQQARNFETMLQNLKYYTKPMEDNAR